LVKVRASNLDILKLKITVLTTNNLKRDPNELYLPWIKKCQYWYFIIYVIEAFRKSNAFWTIALP